MNEQEAEVKAKLREVRRFIMGAQAVLDSPLSKGEPTIYGFWDRPEEDVLVLGAGGGKDGVFRAILEIKELHYDYGPIRTELSMTICGNDFHMLTPFLVETLCSGTPQGAGGDPYRTLDKLKKTLRKAGMREYQ